MGYPKDLLVSRAVIKHGSYAIIPPAGLVNNVIPGFEQCKVSILASPKMGASFVHYLVAMEPEGRNTRGFGGAGIETFVYCMAGKIKAHTEAQAAVLEAGGYMYCPPGDKLFLQNLADNETQLILYKQRYEAVEGTQPWVVVGNVNEIAERIYDDMENVKIIDLLPTDLAFDMNMHILTFEPAGSHPFVETHVQEHGAYLFSGEGLYYLDNEWIPVKKGDYIWFGPYVPQAVYAVGREKLSYLYSKDCNRDAAL
ncbi:(S)-ureidoglycine aminohydrolase [Sporomusa termitida]|uniref:(S)-ureidoglycine aminohydrolase n=1 Tax=Sporomusa termitida TaxID=2377 RepID=A0A517DR85_9FIRM|nr:(S)-ureidoglycine aminohydrolase [Sporomusa termitida]QDR79837.1 (S)-ureidoglycine aminohydrolase [Sporomusa termitida]